MVLSPQHPPSGYKKRLERWDRLHTIQRAQDMEEEATHFLSVRAWRETHSHCVLCPREELCVYQGWMCLASSFQKRQPSGACDSEKKPRHPLHVPGGGDPDGEWDCWPQSFLSDKRHACCTKPSTNQLYISENRWVFHGILCPEEPDRLYGSNRWKPMWCLPSCMKNFSKPASLSRTIT